MSAISEILLSLFGVLAEMSPWLLLGFAVAGALHVFIPDSFVVKHLSGKGLRPIINASLLGVPLPLCSCSVIPVGASLHKRGAGPGATAGFLISAPQTGVDSILVTYSLMGPVFAIFRVLAAFGSGLFGGVWVDRVSPHDDNDLPDVNTNKQAEIKKSAVVRAFKHGFITLPGDLGKSLALGLAIAAVITVLLPADLLGSLPGGKIVTMFAMLVLGLPIYVCATASVPIAAALMFSQGVSPGAALVFLMTGPATNAATIMTLKKMLGAKSVTAYLGAVMISALLAGTALDIFIKIFGSAGTVSAPVMNMDAVSIWKILSVAALVLLMLRKPAMDIFKKLNTSADSKSAIAADINLSIQGMTCPNCAAKVQAAITEQSYVESAAVDVDSASALIQLTEDCADADSAVKSIITLISQMGYQAEQFSHSCTDNCCR